MTSEEYKEKPRKTALFIVDRVVFSKEGADSILAVKTEKMSRVKLCGKTSVTAQGTLIKATGFWDKHEKYGWEFRADYITSVSKNPLEEELEAITCKVQSVKILKEDTGFASAKAVMQDGTEVRLSGRLDHLKEDRTINVLGSWKDDPTYGKEFKVRMWDYSKEGKEGLADKAVNMISCLKENVAVKDVIVKWEDVKFHEDAFSIPDGKGGIFLCSYPGFSPSFDSIRNILSENFPPLKVRYHSHEDPEILNLEDFENAFMFMTINRNLASKINQVVASMPKSVKIFTDLPPKVTKAFVPKDLTPYMDYLNEIHDPSFQVVPLVEQVGDHSENAFLFTVVKNGAPWIIWESKNPQRATFMFRCSDDNYADRLQLVYDFTQAKNSIKRMLLHKDACIEIFGEKPVALIHNNLDSWRSKLQKSING